MCQNRITLKEGWKGIFGPTILSTMFVCSFISAMVVDSMHSLFMGILKYFLRLWFDTAYKGRPFSLCEKISTVNSRLRALNLPHFVQRLPIDVDKNLCYVKASLGRNLFFYILPIVLKDILPDVYFSNFCKLVDGVALLNKTSIPEEDLTRADNLLSVFSKDFQSLYGLRHMTMNIHYTQHLVQCVRESGNLYLQACFRLEGLNGEICALLHGTRHAITQISSQLRLLRDLPLLNKSIL